MDVGQESNGHTMSAAAAPEGCKLVAAGLNAHNQIPENDGKDVHGFVPVAEESSRVLYTCWSSTVVISGSRLHSVGFQQISQNLSPELAATLIDGFGDHNGMIGCLDTAGNLYLISDSGDLVNQSTESSPQIGHIALSGNDKLAISFKQAPNGRLCNILQFETFHEFKGWFKDPAVVQIDPEKQHFMMQGRPIQLVANTGTFTVLMEGGEVQTWGDPRYRSLGRSISHAPAHIPALLDALGGLRIVKIAAGGWMCAALAEDRAAYVWGAGMPGTDKTVKVLREAGAGEVSLISIPSSQSADAEPLDILDIGVGDNHLAVVAEGGRFFVVGDNTNGQLGLNMDEGWVDNWTEVAGFESGSGVRGVVCGPKATFAFIDPQSRHS